jgi:hypothetical protein
MPYLSWGRGVWVRYFRPACDVEDSNRSYIHVRYDEAVSIVRIYVHGMVRILCPAHVDIVHACL